MKIKQPRLWWFCVVLLMAAAAPGFARETDRQPDRDVFNHRQLFIDHRFIASSTNVQLVVNPPKLAVPALSPGTPGAWDDGMLSEGEVTEDGGVFKMWMSANAARVLKGDWKSLDVEEKLGYATSKNGIDWVKPRLGLFEWNGSKANNITCRDTGYVMIDPKGVPSERYKLLCIGAAEIGAKNVYDMLLPKTGGLCFQTSPDGIHWKWNPTQVFPFHPDTLNQIDYDARLGKYVAYIRAWPDGFIANKTFGRTVARIEMDEPLAPWPYEHGVPPILPWGKKHIATPGKEVPTVISFPDYTNGQVWTDVYTPCVTHYAYADDVYLAFPSLNHYHPNAPDANDSSLEIGLVTSRDGIHWQWPTTKSYIAAGQPGSGRSGQLYEMVGMLRVGDRIFQYHAGTDLGHNVNWNRFTLQQLQGVGKIYRTVQRLDGFVSADFAGGGGELTTPPLRFQGKHLQLNLDAAHGSGAVELLDDTGRPIPGYALADCRELKSDSVRQSVSWKNGGNLRPLAGQTIRLHFLMRETKLYAFQFVN